MDSKLRFAFENWLASNAYTEDQVEEQFLDMLNEEDATICGYTFAAGDALKELDPTAFRCGMLDWVDSEYTEVEGFYYPKDRDAWDDFVEEECGECDECEETFLNDDLYDNTPECAGGTICKECKTRLAAETGIEE
jgi:hypothetical protein